MNFNFLYNCYIHHKKIQCFKKYAKSHLVENFGTSHLLNIIFCLLKLFDKLFDNFIQSFQFMLSWGRAGGGGGLFLNGGKEGNIALCFLLSYH
jgi:hypothetical protein